ncbi:hypothetical protein NJ69_12190 [Pseudomonas parafulva]|nr:hypothetical protein NJ69_12190 [Pseudomonas parafulva]
MKGLSPDPGQTEHIVGGRERCGLFFDKHPGDGGGVAQIDGQFQMWTAKEGMLTGQPAHQAGQFRITGEVTIPQRSMTRLTDAVQPVATAIVQGLAKARLAGSDAQEQGFCARVVAPQINQRGADDITAQFVRSDTHGALELSWTDGCGELGSWLKDHTHRKRLAPLELKSSVIFMV